MAPRWTKDEDDYLRKAYPTTPTAEMAGKLGRTYGAVTTRAFEMGLRKTDGYLEQSRAERLQKALEGRRRRPERPGRELPGDLKEPFMHFVYDVARGMARRRNNKAPASAQVRGQEKQSLSV